MYLRFPTSQIIIEHQVGFLKLNSVQTLSTKRGHQIPQIRVQPENMLRQKKTNNNKNIFLGKSLRKHGVSPSLRCSSSSRITIWSLNLKFSEPYI